MEINGKNYQLTYGLRPMFVWEEMAGKPFEISTLFDTYLFCYASIVAGKDNPALDFNEFIDFADEHPEVLKEFNDFVASEKKRRELMGKKKVTKEKNNTQ